MRERLIFVESDPNPSPLLDARLLRLARCSEPEAAISLQIPDVELTAGAELVQILRRMDPSRFLQLSTHSNTRQGVTIDEIGGTVGTDEWWSAEIAFELTLPNGETVMVAPYADGALVFFGWCQGGSAVSSRTIMIEEALALGYAMTK